MQGLVVFQTPRPGNRARPGSTVGLFIAAPPPKEDPGDDDGDPPGRNGSAPSREPRPGAPGTPHGEPAGIEDHWEEEEEVYKDPTIEIHRLPPRAQPVRAASQATQPEGNPAVECEGNHRQERDGSGGVWRGSPSAHTSRPRIAERWATGALLVWWQALLAWWRTSLQRWRALPTSLRRTTPVTLALLLALALITTGTQHRTSPSTGANAQTPHATPAPPARRPRVRARHPRHPRHTGAPRLARATPSVTCRVILDAPAPRAAPVSSAAPAPRIPATPPPTPERPVHAGGAEVEFAP